VGAKTREKTEGIATTNTTITARITAIITTVPTMRAMNNITTTDNNNNTEEGDKIDEIEERVMEALCIYAERTMSPRPEATLH